MCYNNNDLKFANYWINLRKVFNSKMNKIFNKITKTVLVLITAITMLAVTTSTGFAASVSLQTKKSGNNNATVSNNSNIIGFSDNANSAFSMGLSQKKKIGIPNVIVLDWQASSTQIFISIDNYGIDTVDSVTGTISVAGGTSKTFAAYNVSPIGTRRVTVNLNMTKVYEDITISFVGKDGGDQVDSGTSHGHRAVPEYLKNVWLSGTFPSVDASINYHFSKHHNDYGVRAADIQTYLEKATNYRTRVCRALVGMPLAQVAAIFNVTNGTGAIPSRKYKDRNTYEFVILSNSGYKILSYGGR